MTNGNSPKIASEIIDAILAYGDARADKDLVKGTASLKKSIELIRSANLAEPIAPRADADTAGASDLESLLADITAIDTWHRGAPSYEHDAGWFKDRVVRLLEERIADTPASSVAASERADAAPNPSDPDAVLRAYRQGVEDATRADAEKDAALTAIVKRVAHGFLSDIAYVTFCEELERATLGARVDVEHPDIEAAMKTVKTHYPYSGKPNYSWLSPTSADRADLEADATPTPERAGADKDAEKDAARLDWLEQEDEMGFFFNIDHISANINEGFNGFKTLREAIDAAILAANKEPQ